MSDATIAAIATPLTLALLTLPVVIVATELDDNGLMTAVEAGVSGVLRRREATPEVLAHAVVAATDGAARATGRQGR